MAFPPVANITDAAALADELARFRVVDSARLVELAAQVSSHRAAALADHLVRSGAITPFQAQRAMAGEARLLVLGPYRLTGTLGCGTFGPLYTATHTSKPGVFNVRVLPLRNLWKARQAKQLARTLAAVTHPAVAPLVEVDSANGFHYLVWPDSPGERLVDRVNIAGPLSGRAAAALLGHLANALSACHACSATHGALTPTAVAITGNGLPCLLELGAGVLLAQNLADDESVLDSMSAAFASASVLMFAAPELAADPQTPTPLADQYALGAVGYFAVTGLYPYPHPTLAEQLRAKRSGRPPSAAIVNPAISVELAAIFERMMSPNPVDRFVSLTEVEERLATLALVDAATSEASPVDTLRLSAIRDAHEISQAPTWTTASAVNPAARDDSNASITFELPDAPEPILENGGEWMRKRAAVETPPHPLPQRPTLPAPGQHAERESPATAAQPMNPEQNAPEVATPAGTEPPPADSVLWKKVKRNLLFWQPPTDPVQVSVFGPSAVAPGQSINLTIFLHTPDSVTNVKTLARAFQRDCELIGTGYLTREVGRSTELAVHVSVANAGVAKALVMFEWRGQAKRLGFELHVPWESQEGRSPGLVSVGLNNLRIGKIEFRLNVLPRKT